MFEKVDFATALDSQVPEDDDDDTLSLTSTPVESSDPEQEYEVKDILAERRNFDRTEYLVQWVNFPMHECCWEPEGNLGEQLQALWEKKKARQKRGEEEPFDVKIYYDARAAYKRGKQERRRRRNLKRARLGQPVKIYDDENDSDAEDMPQEYEDEATEEDEFEDFFGDQLRSAVPRTLPSAAGATRGSGQENPISAEQAAHPATTDINTTAQTGFGPSNKKASTSSVSRSQVTNSTNASATRYRGTASKATSTSRPKSGSGFIDALPPATTSERGSMSGTNQSAAQKSGLTAKKSNAANPAGSNIFAGGKMRKPRASLKDAMSDVTKDPKAFNKHRYRRLAEVQGRSKEDNPPNLNQVNLFDISKPPTKKSSKTLSIEPAKQLAQQLAEPQSAASTAAPSPTLSIPAQGEAARVSQPAKKKRKTVRFLDDGEALLVHEPAEIDYTGQTPSLTRPLQQPQRSTNKRLRSPPPLPETPTRDTAEGASYGVTQKRLSLADYRNKVFAQDVNKKVKFGSSAAVDVTFSAFPRELQQPWTSDFLNLDTLIVRHTCFSKTMILQANALVQSRLCEGTISSQGSDAILQTVAGYLRSRLLGFYCARSEYSVLIYPTKCDEWKSEALSQEPPAPSDIALRYLVFSSQLDCVRMVRPPSPAGLSASNLFTDSGNSKAPSDRELVARRLLGWDYNKLLPVSPASTKPAVHNFFLVFPESRGAALVSLFRWLRACNPECHIYHSHHSGSWAAFRAQVEHQPGVIIVHEIAVWSLHRIPGLARHLVNNKDNYWCFVEPIQPLPVFPSITLPGSEAVADPGALEFTRLFPHRTAILLTPSFLVSEPQRTSEFMHWFLTSWAKSSSYKLVTAWNVNEFLFNLAMEKAEAREQLFSVQRWKERQNMASDTSVELEANLRSLTESDCNHRFQAATVASELHYLRDFKKTQCGPDEDSCSLIYADPSIDQNDEQSLVNWFGWWSSLRMDQYRKFYVVGSSQTMKFHGSRRGERNVQIPKYTPNTINDPDAVMEVIQENLADEESHKEEHNEAEPSRPAPTSAVAANANRSSAGSTRSATTEAPRWQFRSGVFPSEDFSDMTSYLNDLSQSDGQRVFWTLYKFPVSWESFEMADHFGDFKATWKRIDEWLRFAWPFTFATPEEESRSRRHQRSYNTYVGFFYTIKEEWDPVQSPRGQKPQRHPWIAAYRPVNPHKRPWHKCELFIWDLAATDMFPGDKAPCEEQMSYMHRRLIKLIREDGPKKNPGTSLDRVWLGGFNTPADCQTPWPIDTTLNFLSHMLNNLRELLPAPESQMPVKGYKRVKLITDPEDPPGPPPPQTTKGLGEQPMDMDSGSNDEGASDNEEQRIIFHPPRGTRMGADQRSKCRNRLYEEARLAKARGQEDSMRYEFLPTMEWYGDMRAEGRSYEHIMVESWEHIFNQFHIGASSRTGTAAPTAGALDAADPTTSG